MLAIGNGAIDVAQDVLREALAAYESRSLAPIVDALSAGELRYLRAMSLCMDESLEAPTGSVAEKLGKEPNQLTGYRDRLARDGIILATGWGKVRFGIPYLRQCLEKTHVQTDSARLAAEWRV